MISIVLDALSAVLLLLGLVLLTISMVGVLRLPTSYGQLHAHGLATPAVIAILASSVGTEDPAVITFAALSIVFIALTSPVAGHAIARAVHRRDQASPGGASTEQETPDGSDHNGSSE